MHFKDHKTVLIQFVMTNFLNNKLFALYFILSWRGTCIKNVDKKINTVTKKISFDGKLPKLYNKNDAITNSNNMAGPAIKDILLT